MERLFKDATKYTPEIDFDSDSGKLLIKGKSYPENCNEFFEDVIEWIENYFEAPPKGGTVFTFDIPPYYNSSTSKTLFDILDILADAKENNDDFSVIWQYDKDNESAEEMGEEFQEDFEELNIQLKPYNE